jgi:hypothetical protein
MSQDSMTLEDWQIYVAATELKIQDIAERLQAAMDLIRHLVDDAKKPSGRRIDLDEVMKVVERYESLECTDEQWALLILDHEPPSTTSDMQILYSKIAVEYYKALEEGKDPGDAEAFIKAHGRLFSEDIGWRNCPDSEHLIKQAAPWMNLKRVVAGFGRDEE